MHCQYNRSEGELKLDVEQKIKGMLQRFPELAKLPYKTVPLQPSQVNKELKVGDMTYIAITARPGIAYAVGKLSRGMHQPNKFIVACSKTSLVICETIYLFHSVMLARHRKSLSCSQN